MSRFSLAAGGRWGLPGLLLLAGCVEPYLPAVVDAPASYLVVDGFINGNGRTRIKLSRTINVAATASPPAETKATLAIVDEAGARYLLRETSAGFYQSDSLTLNPARQYQLRIATTGANAGSYASDLVPLKVTPPIDNLNWTVNGTQVRVQLNTHDASGQSRYYRWNFVETWEFHSAYNSTLQYDPVRKIIVSRAVPIYTCWRTEQPSLIKQVSTAQLSQDALINEPVLLLSGRTERLQIRYSVLVKQYTETPQEFAYYELLRKNTEAVGGVNDPLPSQLSGNVHRTDNASEPVLGYVSAHTVQTKRLFISRQDLPAQTTAQFDSPYADCMLGQEYFCDPATRSCIVYPQTKTFQLPNSVPIDLIPDPITGQNPGGYSSATRDCADCRVRGTLTKPSFW